MTFSRFLKYSAIPFFLLTFCQLGVSRELKTYRGDITVPIVEKDFVYARNNAFQTLQKLLLSAAFKDLIGDALYQEHHFQLSKDKSLKPSKFLVSAKILKEEKDTKNFHMELEGKIDISSLSDALRNKNLILKDDPWYSATVLVESNLSISHDSLKRRLSTFHVKADEFHVVNLSNFDWQQRDQAEFIEALHSLFPSGRILYLLDTILNEDKSKVVSLRAQIFRMTDRQKINSFRLNLTNPSEIDKIDKNSVNSFLRLFSIQSIVANLYNEGNESFSIIDVEGLENPYIRYIFENKVLAANRTIKSYKLTAVSRDSSRYEIQSGYRIEELEAFFKKKNKDFYFITEKGDANSLVIETFYRHNDTVRNVNEWTSDERILKLINDSMTENDLNPDTSKAGSLFDNPTVDENYIPRWIEQEPNNNSSNLNNLPPESLVLGYISSRADEDVYQLKRSIKSSTLIVEWIRIGKTNLSPQLRLYGQDFTFINSYNLIGSQNKMSFQYTFKDKPPHTVYFRITDKTGFIQGETGGFKSFYYLLRCHWQANSSQADTSLASLTAGRDNRY